MVTQTGDSEDRPWVLTSQVLPKEVTLGHTLSSHLLLEDSHPILEMTSKVITEGNILTVKTTPPTSKSSNSTIKTAPVSNPRELGFLPGLRQITASLMGLQRNSLHLRTMLYEKFEQNLCSAGEMLTCGRGVGMEIDRGGLPFTPYSHTYSGRRLPGKQEQAPQHAGFSSSLPLSLLAWHILLIWQKFPFTWDVTPWCDIIMNTPGWLHRTVRWGQVRKFSGCPQPIRLAQGHAG